MTRPAITLEHMLSLLHDCRFLVRDMDSGLHTDVINLWETNSPQLRTVMAKNVVAIVPEAASEGEGYGLVYLEVSEKTPDEDPDKATEGRR